MTMLLRVIACCLLLLSANAMAVIETYEFSDPQLEQRYRELSAELRCPKCQNQNIADSNAPISQDLRKLLYKQLEDGSSDEEILQHMVARYGEFVRYRPRFGGATTILWLAPALLLLMGVVVAGLTLRGRQDAKTTNSGQLSAEEEQSLQALIDKTEQDK